ncbi:MAG: MarR family transcriptional regulator [Polaribacter sp.]|nr:MarR family transcriptional regulator [Polaribacter sp.]MDG1994678.1 MarR family transcriptional regulator [Polaribacter sp.]
MISKEIEIDFENSVGPWIGRTMKVIDYYLHEEIKLKKLDVTKEQIIILKNLFLNDGIHQNELAFLTSRDKSSLTRLLVKMEKKGYIKRKKSKEDKRINMVFITNVGKEMFAKTRPVIQKTIDTIEKNISKKEKETMILLLKKIQTNFELTLQTL